MSDSIRLTAGSKAGGCAAKMSPRMLDSVLRRLPGVEPSRGDRGL